MSDQTTPAQATAPVAQAPVTPAAFPKGPRQITSGRVQPAEFRRVVYQAMPEAGTTLEEVLNPLYFLNVAQGWKAFDRVEVCWEDRSAFAELVVLHADRAAVKVAPLGYRELDPVEKAAAKEDPDYLVEHAGEHARWRVVRRADGHVLQEKLGTENAARKWLREYKKAL